MALPQRAAPKDWMVEMSGEAWVAGSYFSNEGKDFAASAGNLLCHIAVSRLSRYWQTWHFAPQLRGSQLKPAG